MKCCKYIELNENSCSCSIFTNICKKKIECWCCFIDWWKALNNDGFSEINLLEISKNMSKNKYFPKTFRKGLIEFLENIENYKKQIADLENNFKFSNKDFNNNPEIIYNSIEISLIAKLLSFVNILDLYIEICNLFLEIMYFEIVNLTYTNLFNFLENIDNTIPYLVKIFLGLSKKIKNSIEFSTLMNKMISFDNNLVKLSEELNIKIVNYK